MFDHFWPGLKSASSAQALKQQSGLSCLPNRKENFLYQTHFGHFSYHRWSLKTKYLTFNVCRIYKDVLLANLLHVGQTMLSSVARPLVNVSMQANMYIHTQHVSYCNIIPKLNFQKIKSS